MKLLRPDPELVPAGLAALKVVAAADGAFDLREKILLGAIQDFFGTAIDVDALEPIEPAELAARIEDPELREQLIHGMIVLSMIDGEASEAESEAVDRFAAALEVDSAAARNLRRLAAGQLLPLRYDVLRRFWAREKIQEDLRARGFGGMLKALGALLKLREDRAIAGRYRALESYPEGSLGRVYHDHMRADGFALPGEKGSPPEPIVIHDLTHVLSGYGTDPAGETRVACFHAGYRRRDPFVFVMFAMLQFHMGVRVTPLARSETGFFEPRACLRALERGAGMNRDLTRDWDWWPVMDRPVDEVRELYAIAPL